MMTMTKPVVLILVLLAMPAWSEPLERGFLQARRVDRSSIDGVLKEVLGSAHGVESTALSAIKTKITPLFSSLPKNSAGRLTPVYMKYAVMRYFRQTYGWSVKGFEEKANVSQVSSANSTETPMNSIETPEYVEKVIEKMLSHGGFALEDIVIAIAAVERLIKDEVVKDVENAFVLNNVSTKDRFSESTAIEIMASYYIVEHLEGTALDQKKHKMERKSIEKYYPQWWGILDMIEDVVHNDAYVQQARLNPFATRSLTFENAVHLAQTLNQVFGPLSNDECHAMRERFTAMDVHVTGRVQLANYYKATPEYAWQFLESPAYLESVGAVEASSKFHGPQIIIPNYMANNCLSTSVYYKVCCLNECDGIFQHLEATIMKPTASAAEIKEAVEGGIPDSSIFSSSAKIEARNLSASLHERLLETAKVHGDAIPLHGRLFQQWLHYAFPQECAFPYTKSTAKMPVPAESKALVKDEAIELIESDFSQREPSPEAGLDMWSLEEELLEPFHTHSSWHPRLRTVFTFVMIVSMGFLLLNEMLRAARRFGVDSTKAQDRSAHAKIEHYV